jgi:hypothetical protein
MSRNEISLAVVMGVLSTAVRGQELFFERIASGLGNPTFVTHAPGDADRLFVALRYGIIRILDLTGTGQPLSTFMATPNVNGSSEGGLLGLAFHPNYQVNRHFYVNYTLTVGNSFRTRIARFTSSPNNTADPASMMIVLEIDQPQPNHNAGWIGFSPIDNYLYIATGDGGSGNDSGPGHTLGIGNSQDITDNLLGKMLRVDIDGDDFPNDPNCNYAIPPGNPFAGIAGDDEIWLYGLRNPFRCSFDRETGDLYIGDVGQGAREEISFFPANGSASRNMGWRLREGTIQTPGVGGPQPADGLNPIYDYVHPGPFGGRAVVGGTVYRGPVQCLNGTYIFGDYESNNFWSFRFDGSAPSSFDGTNHTPIIHWNGNISHDVGSIENVVCFGEDLVGNLYIVDFAGDEIFKLVDGNVGQGTYSPACHSTYGAGCASPFALSSATVPMDDAVVTFDITGAPETQAGSGICIGVMVISFSGMPLPGLNLTSIGAAPGCNAYIGGLDVLTSFVCSGSNTSSVMLDLPPGISPGTVLFEQAAAVITPTASNTAGLVTSNGLTTLINIY